jgi:hypothetical protein
MTAPGKLGAAGFKYGERVEVISYGRRGKIICVGLRWLHIRLNDDQSSKGRIKVLPTDLRRLKDWE